MDHTGLFLSRHSRVASCQGECKGVRIKITQIVNTLANTDEGNRQVEFVCHRHQHTASGGAIEFGHTQPVNCDRLRKGLDLGKRVLAGRPVDDQQCLLRRLWIDTPDYPMEFAQLFHQVNVWLVTLILSRNEANGGTRGYFT